MTHALGRALMVVGAMLMAMGALLMFGGRFPWLGRLPGDLLIHRERFTVLVPLTTCLILSALCSLVAWLFWRR